MRTEPKRSIKRLRSVVHSVAHHAESGLCFVHPHLGKFHNDAQCDDLRLDLLDGGVIPIGLNIPEPLSLAIKALSERFRAILESEKIESDWIDEAIVQFIFHSDVYPRGCVVTVTTSDGRRIETGVALGKKERFIHGGE